jgi:D-psicose/D-tagatose/L-ribulose 3-epimerase
LGSETLCGPIYQPLGGQFFTGQGPTEEEKQRAAEVHRQAAEYAQSAGVVLCLECLNRFECYFLNTMADAAAHAKRVDHPNLGLMYDSFHGNIEENDPVGTVAEYAGTVCHFHVSSNNRGTPGKGHIPFGEMFKALKKAGYDKWLTIEAFGRSLPELAATTCVWRDLSASNEECYGEGLKMIKEQWAAA